MSSTEFFVVLWNVAGLDVRRHRLHLIMSIAVIRRNVVSWVITAPGSMSSSFVVSWDVVWRNVIGEVSCRVVEQH
jgi:hypothetical protein